MTTKAEERRASGLGADLDEPLDETTQGELNASFQAHHRYEFCMIFTPSDCRVGRLFLENQRCQATVIPIRKVQSLAASSLPVHQSDHV